MSLCCSIHHLMSMQLLHNHAGSGGSSDIIVSHHSQQGHLWAHHFMAMTNLSSEEQTRKRLVAELEQLHTYINSSTMFLLDQLVYWLALCYWSKILWSMAWGSCLRWAQGFFTPLPQMPHPTNIWTFPCLMPAIYEVRSISYATLIYTSHGKYFPLSAARSRANDRWNLHLSWFAPTPQCSQGT